MTATTVTITDMEDTMATMEATTVITTEAIVVTGSIRATIAIMVTMGDITITTIPIATSSIVTGSAMDGVIQLVDIILVLVTGMKVIVVAIHVILDRTLVALMDMIVKIPKSATMETMRIVEKVLVMIHVTVVHAITGVRLVTHALN